jgi:esterase/lipase superfamily enzyme
MSNLFFITNRIYDEKTEEFTSKLTDKLYFGNFNSESKLQPICQGTMDTCLDTFLKSLSNFEKCFIFIHGFNTNFELGSKRLEVFASNCPKDEKIAFILLSWPSQDPQYNMFYLTNKLMEYTGDKKRTIQTSKLFVPFLEELCKIFPKQVHIMAHSMGGYLLWKSFSLMSQDIKLGKIFFCASDIKVERVQKDYHRMKGKVVQVVNYSSKKDSALKYSRILSSGHMKIGAIGIHLKDEEDLLQNIFVDDNISTFDQYFSHSYFNSNEISLDIFTQIFDNKTEKERGLERHSSGEGWVLKK